MEVSFSDLWKMLNVKLVADLDSRRVDVHLGVAELKGISIPAIQALSDQREALETLLSDAFISRRVMWMDLRRERPDYVVKSLKDLAGIMRGAARQFADTKRKKDVGLASVLLAIANEAEVGMKLVCEGIEDERDPANTGMDASAADYMNRAIIDVRKAAYPLIELLVTLLPETSPVRIQAASTLQNGYDVLNRAYSQPASELPRATVTIS